MDNTDKTNKTNKTNDQKILQTQNPAPHRSLRGILSKLCIFLQSYGIHFRSYGTGFIGSLFLIVMHGTVEGQTAKNTLSLINLIYGGITFLPAATVNLLDLDYKYKVTANCFFAGTITPFVIEWFFKKRLLQRFLFR